SIFVSRSRVERPERTDPRLANGLMAANGAQMLTSRPTIWLTSVALKKSLSPELYSIPPNTPRPMGATVKGCQCAVTKTHGPLNFKKVPVSDVESVDAFSNPAATLASNPAIA